MIINDLIPIKEQLNRIENKLDEEYTEILIYQLIKYPNLLH